MKGHIFLHVRNIKFRPERSKGFRRMSDWCIIDPECTGLSYFWVLCVPNRGEMRKIFLEFGEIRKNQKNYQKCSILYVSWRLCHLKRENQPRFWDWNDQNPPEITFYTIFINKIFQNFGKRAQNISWRRRCCKSGHMKNVKLSFRYVFGAFWS